MKRSFSRTATAHWQPDYIEFYTFKNTRLTWATIEFIRKTLPSCTLTATS